MDASFEKSVDLNEAEGWSLIFIARNGKCVGWVGMQDKTRAEAKESLADLKQNGVRRVAMISGDRQAVATRVAEAATVADEADAAAAAGVAGGDFLLQPASRSSAQPSSTSRHVRVMRASYRIGRSAPLEHRNRPPAVSAG